VTLCPLLALKACEFNFVLASKLRDCTPETFPKLLTLQEMRLKHPSWLVRRTLDFRSVCSGEYTVEYLAVSHRWESRSDPDPRVEQLLALVAHLKAQLGIKYVFYDYMSLAQGERTPQDKAEFQAMLPNINFIYLGARVLILMDLDYAGRFWTGFEAFLAMMMPTPDGLIGATTTKRRYIIECMHGTNENYGKALEAQWLHCTAQTALQELSADCIVVTNQSDKTTQLAKILPFNAQIMEAMASQERTDDIDGLLEEVGRSSSMPAPADDFGSVDDLMDEFGTHAIDGLSALLAAVNLSDSLDAAATWCKEQGLEAVTEIKEIKEEEAFVDALKLKPGKAKLLLKRISEIG